MDDDIIRFMVATDNHLGYAEKDPVRGVDSLAAFEEVLRKSVEKKVDFILLAGDLFHENKPSRKTLHGCMELLRKYCFGAESVYIEVLNDQSEIFKSCLGHVNYEDPFQSIRLPIFSIHGNHDDSSREGGNGEALAALDLLAVSNLINYFGKTDRVDEVEITPILIRKGENTKIALYGLGAMRDERLNRMWNQKRVKFVRLTEEQGRDDYYNIFLLHQNRDYGRGKKNCVHESMIPDWMDLVIWGNEHECQPNLAESLVGTYRILQPGSSIACSLSSGESHNLAPKHMNFLEVKGRKFRSKALPFTTGVSLRPFLYRDIALRDLPGLDPAHPKIEEQIKGKLARIVEEMIIAARAYNTVDGEAEEGIEEELNESLPARKYRIIDPEKVLLRLKVDFDGGYTTINHQRFGSQYVGQVANPTEVLLISKKKKEGGGGDRGGIRRPRGEIEGGRGDREAADGEDEEEMNEETIHKIKIEDLVKETLTSQRHSLHLLKEEDMARALDDYILKKTTTAIQDLVEESLEKRQRELIRKPATAGGGAIAGGAAVGVGGDAGGAVGGGIGGGGGGGVLAAGYHKDDAMLLDDDDEEEQVVPSSSSRARAAGAGTGRGTAGGRGGRGGRGAATTRKAATKTTATASKGRGKANKAAPSDDDEEEEADKEEEEEEEVTYRKPANKSSASSSNSRATAAASSSGQGKITRTAAQAATKKTKQYMIEESDGDEDAEEEEASDAEEEEDDEEMEVDEEKEEEDYGRSKGKKQPVSKATNSRGKAASTTAAATAVSAAASKKKATASSTAAAYSRKKPALHDNDDDVIEIIDSDHDDDHNSKSRQQAATANKKPAAVATSSRPMMTTTTTTTTTAASATAGGGGVKKRQLPLPFSQQQPLSQQAALTADGASRRTGGGTIASSKKKVIQEEVDEEWD